MVLCNITRPIVKKLHSPTRLAGLRKHYAKGEDDIFYKDPPFLYLAEYAARYGNNFLQFIDHVEGAIASMSFSAASEGDAVDGDLRHSVHLMTALRAKGKEYETVVILETNDGMWPILPNCYKQPQ